MDELITEFLRVSDGFILNKYNRSSERQTFLKMILHELYMPFTKEYDGPKAWIDEMNRWEEMQLPVKGKPGKYYKLKKTKIRSMLYSAKEKNLNLDEFRAKAFKAVRERAAKYYITIPDGDVPYVYNK